MKEIAEIAVALFLILTTIIGAVKYWKFRQSQDRYTEEVVRLQGLVDQAKKEGKEEIEKTMYSLKECRIRHDECQKDVMAHLRDSGVHRDVKLEEFRHAVLTKAIDDLKEDFSRNITAIETRLSEQLGSLERTFKNGCQKTS